MLIYRVADEHDTGAYRTGQCVANGPARKDGPGDDFWWVRWMWQNDVGKYAIVDDFQFACPNVEAAVAWFGINGLDAMELSRIFLWELEVPWALVSDSGEQCLYLPGKVMNRRRTDKWRCLRSEESTSWSGAGARGRAAATRAGSTNERYGTMCPRALDEMFKVTLASMAADSVYRNNKLLQMLMERK